MSTIHYDQRRAICFLCGIIALWATGAQATLPPDPDNAALLYYQAWFVRPGLDTATYTALLHVTLGANPDEQVRLYMHGCRDTIRLTDAATKIPQCNWGILYSQGHNLRPIVAQLEQLILLLEVDAWIFAADNDYRSGLDRCLGIRRFAAHLADETIYGYGVSLRTHQTASDYIQHVLGAVASDSETLLWLQAQISEAQGPPGSSGKQVELTMEQSLQSVRVDPQVIAMWRDSVSFMTPDEKVRQELLSLTDEEVLERAQQSCQAAVASIQSVIASQRPYVQKHSELHALADELQDKIEVADPIGFAFMPGASASPEGLIVTQYDIYTRCLAHYNAVRAAIDICLQRAKSGQLPQSLPAYLPKDPFSGEDFEHQITDQGFILRCRSEDLREHKVWEYEFSVPK